MKKQNVERTVVALIPAYKPDEKLIEIVDKLLATKVVGAIYCVDDGSGKAYAYIFRALKDLGCHVVSHCTNLGKGMALKTGLNVIACSCPDIHGVVTFDADGQHVVKDICSVVSALKEKSDTLVLGCRGRFDSAPLRSRIGNHITNQVFYFFTGLKLRDTQTGLRGFPATIIPQLLRFKTNGYDFELDMLIHASHQHLQVRQVSISTIYVNENETSHFSPLWDSMKIYFVFFRFVSTSLITAGIDYAVFSILLLLGGSIAVSLVSARICAALFQFIVSHNYVFHERGEWGGAAIKYVGVLVLLSVFVYTGIYFSKLYMGVSPLLSKVVIEGCVFLFSFLVQRDFVFVSKVGADNGK